MKKLTENTTSSKILENDEIANIHFYKIDFSGKDLSFKTFNDCVFESCNLSNIKIKDTTLNNVIFIKSKILGVNFSYISTFLSSFKFLDCKISLCYFMGLNIKNTIFADSEITETDFSNTNLESSDFSYCKLDKSIFSRTNLKKSNFVGAYNFSIDPNNNNIEKAKFSSSNVFGLLAHLDIIIE